ncbi:MAG: DNA primase [Candidatus Krumholzibacteria bacterium]|nr:DNA primase [Candidatus Krumholzibacteria bacterium]
MIPQTVIDDIRDRTDIVDVIGGVLDLKRAGRSLKALCPFHGEKTPSFMVNPERQIYHCFGCGKGGNVFSFLMEYEGVGFVEAVRKLAAPLGINVDQYLTGTEDTSRLDPYYRAMEFATKYFREALKAGDPAARTANEYLDRRGFPREVIDEFSIGFAPPAWEGLYRAATEKGLPREILLESGLVMRSRGGSGYRDYFRNRVIFPISSLAGRVVGFAGRVMDDSEPKYLNSMENPVYSKGKILYGLDKARDSIRTSKTAIIVEGYIDHLMLWSKGITNVTAVCGTALTEEQARLLARYAKRVYIINDGDRAGIRAAVRAADQLIVQALETYVVVLPENEDPDSYIRKEGVEALRELMRDAPDYFTYLREEAGKGRAVASRRRQVVEHLLGSISRVDDAVRREILLQELSGHFEIPVETLRTGLTAARPARRAHDGPDRAARAPGGKRERIQKEMFRLGLLGRDMAALIVENIIEEDLEGEPFRLFHRVFREAFEAGEDPAGAKFAASISDPGLAGLASEIALMDPPPGPPGEVLRDMLLWVKKASLKSEMEAVRERIRQLHAESPGETTDEEIGIAEAYRQIARELGKLEIREDSRLDGS